MSDPLDALLGGLRVPAPRPGLVDRIVAEASRPDRAPLPTLPPQRRTMPGWSRRGVWTAVLAINLVLASAVAAAFGTGALTGTRLAAVAQHVVAQFHRTVPAAPVHRVVAHDASPRPPAAVPLTSLPLPVLRPPPIAAPMAVKPLPARPLVTAARRAQRFARPLRMYPRRASIERRGLGWRDRWPPRATAVRQQDGRRAGFAPERQRPRFWRQRGLDQPRFGRGAGFGPPRFRGGGGRFRPWGGPRGGGGRRRF